MDIADETTVEELAAIRHQLVHNLQVAQALFPHQMNDCEFVTAKAALKCIEDLMRGVRARA